MKILKKFPFQLLFACFLWAGCGSDEGETVKMAGKDGSIDAAEFQKIAAILRKDRRGAAQYKTDEAVCNFIRAQVKRGTTCAPCGNAAATDASSNPNTSPAKAASTIKPVYNAYIENSMSMDGYVNGSTEFKNAIYGFLSDILLKTNGLTDSLNLFYVNSEMFPFKEDVRDFIENLNPASFKARGGKRSSSDIGLVLEKIVQQTNPNKVSLMVSDCVFSPGKGKNAKDYLVSQGIGVKRAFADALMQHPNLATVVIQLKSSFSGSYYDYENRPVALNAKRPYYIWLIGNDLNIKKLFETIDVKQIKSGGIAAIYAMYPSGNAATPAFKILRTDKMGNFDLDRNNPQNAVIDAKVADRTENAGQFQLAVGIDLSKTGLSDDFLTESKNYRINADNYTIAIQKIPEQEKRNDPALTTFSHKLLLNTKSLKTQAITIELLPALPTWVTASNSEDDRQQSGDELNKTFGIKYLVEGISDAYASQSKGQNAFFSIKLNIKK
ncbi:MAG: hypothetical protein RIS64_3345 [Bacteroidota bacterium]|jgi:hypothetical protein